MGEPLHFEAVDMVPSPYWGWLLRWEDQLVVFDYDFMPDEAELARFLPTYTEVSASGRGVHIWCRGSIPPRHLSHGVEGRYSKDRVDRKIEAYMGRKAIAMTGDILPGAKSAILPRQDAIERVFREEFRVPGKLKLTNRDSKNYRDYRRKVNAGRT